MQEPTGVMHRWLVSDHAATAIEYSLLASGIAMAIVLVVAQIGTDLEALFASVATGF